MAAPTVITVQDMKGPFEAVSAGQIDFTFAAGTVTDGDVFTVSGREILIVYNSNVGAQTITIESEDDERGRQEDITTYSLAAGDFAYFTGGLTNEPGWMNSSRQIRVTVSHAEVKLAVLRLPAGWGR